MIKSEYKEFNIDIQINTKLLIEDIFFMSSTMDNKDIENVINKTIDLYVSLE